jgi:hypothetical protein
MSTGRERGRDSETGRGMECERSKESERGTVSEMCVTERGSLTTRIADYYYAWLPDH